jgi:hypothetical protein
MAYDDDRKRFGFTGTADELLAIAREGRPEVRYVTNDKRNTIGAWNEKLGRYQSVAGLMLGGREVDGVPTGRWVELPYEYLVNGKPLPLTWIEEVAACSER